MKALPLITAFFAAALTTGCGIAPMPAEYRNFAKVDQKPEAENSVRIAIFNSTRGWMYGVDKSGHLNIKIDDRSVGHIPMGRFRVIELKPGFHDVYLERRDLWKVTSNHRIEIGPGSKAIRIFAFEILNDLEVLDEHPFNFDATYKIVE